MKIAFTGANGMLGHAFQIITKENAEHEYIFADSKTVDITNRVLVDEFFEKNKFDVLINCAAYTKVDDAELNENTAKSVNGYAVGYLAEKCKEYERLFVTYSTDYVFDGENEKGYDEDSKPNPLNAYGRSKLVGEELTQINADDYYIIRTQWLYGPEGKNFVNTILNAYNEGKDLKIVNDQFGSPTYTIDLAKKTLELIEKSTDFEFGIYHFTNDDVCSWYDFAVYFLQKANPEKQINVTPVDSSAFPRPAKRPHFSTLLNTKTEKMRSWKDAVEEFLEK